MSLNQIDMQLDSGGMEQCKDVNVAAGRPKFDLASHMHLCFVETQSSEDEGRDTVQSDGITRKLCGCGQANFFFDTHRTNYGVYSFLVLC